MAALPNSGLYTRDGFVVDASGNRVNGAMDNGGQPKTDKYTYGDWNTAFGQQQTPVTPLPQMNSGIGIPTGQQPSNPNNPADLYEEYNFANPASIPSQEYLAQQVTNPAMPVGSEQKYTPQQSQDGEMVAPGTGQVGANKGATAAQTGTGQIDPAQANQNVQAGMVDPALATAQQGSVVPESLVREQLKALMKDVDEGNAPWAEASIRKANEAMMARGMGQSSMAGAAIAQSVIEAALPIAQMDAATFGEMNLQNLRNRQETMLTNTAAQNAAKHLNAQSQTDVNKFMAGMKNDVLKFNVEQKNAMDQFNTEQRNSVKTFYDKMNDAAEQFNANNAMLVATSNAEWRRSINTANTAGENATNMMNAQNAFNLSGQAMADLWQRSRDVFNWANQSADNERDRAFKLTLYSMQRSDYLDDVSNADKKDLMKGIGNIAYNIFDNYASGAYGSSSTTATSAAATNGASTSYQDPYE